MAVRSSIISVMVATVILIPGIQAGLLRSDEDFPNGGRPTHSSLTRTLAQTLATGLWTKQLLCTTQPPMPTTSRTPASWQLNNQPSHHSMLSSQNKTAP